MNSMMEIQCSDLQTPIIMHNIQNHRGNVVKIKPWMEIPDDDFFIIKPDKDVTMTEIKNDTSH